MEDRTFLALGGETSSLNFTPKKPEREKASYSPLSGIDVFFDFHIKRVIPFQGFQGLSLKDLRSNSQGIFQMFALFSISLRNCFHRFLCKKDGEWIIPFRSFLLRKDLFFPLDPMGQGIGDDRLDMFDIDLRIF